jgi:chromosome segregation ATPase
MMYLLTETAIGDSTNYEVLSFDEVEQLKKERSLLSTRIQSTKRKLAMETKIRDAAQSLGRLYSPPSPRSSGEYGADGTDKSHRRSRSIFGRSGAGEALDKSDSELAMSQRRCEELAQQLWKLEQKSNQISQRLLEHTAGVLQMTHKGLKKAPKNVDGADGLDDGYDFDDRSLYRTTEHLDSYGMNGRIEVAPVGAAVNPESQKRLEELSERLFNMMAQANPDEFVEPPPHPGGPSSTIGAHIAYLEHGLQSLHSVGSARSLPVDAGGAAPEAEGAWKMQLTDINNRVQSIVDRFGLTRSPTLPPPPAASDGEGLQEQLSYLQTGVDGLASRVDGLLEQKSILTTQIQQQRELNSKSDAERDAHIADLTEQLAQVRRDYEASERESQAHQAELETVMQQLEALRHDGSPKDEVKASLVHAEGEIARLQSVIDSLHTEADLRAEEVREAHDRAEEVREANERAGQEVAQLEAEIQQIRSEADSRLKEVLDERHQLDVQLAEADAMLKDAVNQREEATERLEEAFNQRDQADAHLKEALGQRDQAEENAARLQKEMTELEGEVVRITTELTMVKAELDGAYGTRAQRAAEVAANPEIQKEIDSLHTRNIELTEELAMLKGQQGGGGDLQQRADTLEKELRETLDDYEAMTKASIEFEKEREQFESLIDSMRDRCEQLEQQLSEERINWMNLNSPGSMGRDGTSETTSTMVLKNEFKKMMRDTRNENMKILKVSPLKSTIFFSTVTNSVITEGARRAAPNRRVTASPQERARSSDWQTHTQPRWHPIMMMTLFFCFRIFLSFRPGFVQIRLNFLSLYNNCMSASLPTASAMMLLPYLLLNRIQSSRMTFLNQHTHSFIICRLYSHYGPAP